MTSFESCPHGKFHANCFDCGRESFKEELAGELEKLKEEYEKGAGDTWGERFVLEGVIELVKKI